MICFTKRFVFLGLCAILFFGLIAILMLPLAARAVTTGDAATVTLNVTNTPVRGDVLVPMFITTLSQTRMKSRFLAADEYISPKKSNSVGASWLKPSRKIAHLRLSSPPYIMEAQRRQAR